MNLKEFEYKYFLGIGGIGMSSLARYCSLQNKNVLGYDRQRSEICIELENEEISINYGEVVPKILKNEKVKEKVNLKLSGKVVTKVSLVKNYCPAEEYHQRYLEKR